MDTRRSIRSFPGRVSVLVSAAGLGFALVFSLFPLVAAHGVPGALHSIKPEKAPVLPSGRAPAIMLFEKLIASNGTTGDQFGRSVAISGNTLVLGANRVDILASDAGAAYVFEKTPGGSWTEVAILTPSDGSVDDWFGHAVAMDDDTIVVGARFGDSSVNNSGSAYIFERNQGGPDNWGEVIELNASDPAFDDRFGSEVAISGDIVMVGAYRDDDFGTSSGSVYVFGRDQGGPNNWGQVTKINPDDAFEHERFGDRLSLDGTTLLAGESWDNHAGYRSGAAYLFEKDQGGVNNWGQIAKITSTSTVTEDFFGSSVALADDLAIIGARFRKGTGGGYVFRRDEGGPGNWGEVTELTGPNIDSDDEFGWEVAVYSDTVLVVSRLDDEVGIDAGSVYVFDRHQGGPDNWGFVELITAEAASPGDHFGEDIAILSSTVLIGAHLGDGNFADTGAAYIFDLNVSPTDLEISAAVTPTQALPGMPVTLTVTYANVGLEPASSVVLTDIVTYPLINLAYTSTGSVISPVLGADYVWQVADLYPGEGGVITLTGTVDRGLLTDTLLTNQAEIVGTINSFTISATTQVQLPVSLPRIRLSQREYFVSEHQPAAASTLTTTPVNPFAQVTGHYSSTPGTASEGEDFLAVSGTQTVTAGLTQTYFSIPILDDLIYEEAETVYLTLSDPYGGVLVNLDGGVLTILDNETQTLLPIILVNQNRTFGQPIKIGDAVPGQPVTVTGTVFYTATLEVPDYLPTWGRYYLSSEAAVLSETLVDDRIDFIWNTLTIFSYEYSTPGQGPIPAIVELPDPVLSSIVGKEILIKYVDVYGDWVGATEIWLYWDPQG